MDKPNKATKFLEEKGYNNRLMYKADHVKDWVYVSDVMMEFLESEMRKIKPMDIYKEDDYDGPGM